MTLMTARAGALHYLGVADLGGPLWARELSALEATSATLKRIARLGPGLNAFITLMTDEATAAAREADRATAAGIWHGPLHGVPIGVKDMFDTAGTRTTAACRQFARRVPSQDASAVARLKHAGAVIVGKTNLHELGRGTTSLESHFGAVRNPWSADHVAGGSSGGSAAAVASGLCFATLDTDAIGSCRLPASCCGVVGFKPTFGNVDVSGVLAGEPGDAVTRWLVHVALMARSVVDAALVYGVLAGVPSPPVRRKDAERPLRIGRVTNAVATDAVRAASRRAVDVLASLGDQVRDVTAPLETPAMDLRNISADRAAIAGSLFRDVDILVLPTVPAPTSAVRAAKGDAQAVSPANTFFANYFGLPAISVPNGLDATGLPVGVQFVGAPGDDWRVLSVAMRFEAAAALAARHPVP